MSVRPVQMEFKYGTSFMGDSPEAYERLLHDALRGDATLFTRADEVEAEWRIVAADPRGVGVGAGPVGVRGGQPGPAGGRRAARGPRAKLEAAVSRAAPERSRWRGEDVRVEELVDELARLHRGFRRRARARAGPDPEPDRRPASAVAASAAEDALAGLGAHSPSRTLVLRRHGADRLDAEAGDRERAARGGRPGGRLPRPGDADGRRLPPGACRLAAGAPAAQRSADGALAP